jgi:hypothetical protein
MPRLSSLDRAILTELQKVKQDPKIQNKQIMEWSTGPVTAQSDEELVNLPELGINVAFKPKKKKGAN